jgi:SAM-dependent methyltransferase
VDRRTRAVYESHARTWIAQRGVDADAQRGLRAFEPRLRRRARVADLGCGPGWFAARLRRRGHRVIGFDLTWGMLEAAREAAPRAPWVQGDLARLPFARESLDGAWAKNSYIHLPFAELPSALADLHRALRPRAPVALSFIGWRSAGATRSGVRKVRGSGEGKLDGRLFTMLSPDAAHDLFEGAGFTVTSVVTAERRFWVEATRARALPDSIRPGLDLLVVGLNPSPRAADTGVAYAGPNNRFWPAALRAGWVERDRDPRDALRHGIGFTDLVKRVTPGVNGLRPDEYRHGAERLLRLVARFRPRALAFVGLTGFRHAVDPQAEPGPVRGGFGGRAAYVLPSSSGRNARVSLAELVRHMRRARALAH